MYDLIKGEIEKIKNNEEQEKSEQPQNCIRRADYRLVGHFCRGGIFV